MKITEINEKNIEKKLLSLRKASSHFDTRLLSSTQKIVDDVKKNGDKALFKYTKKYDNQNLNKKTVKVSSDEIESAKSDVSPKLIKHLNLAIKRIGSYQKRKLPKSKVYKDSLGNELGWEIRPIERVGIYVPGGKASYPSTVLMTAVPAKVAGVENISIVTPCPNGEVCNEVLVAASLLGIENIYKVGGAQSISALAYGTDSIPRVDKIVGPGNIYVAIAKKLVFGAVDIDMIAGPSEVLVIADGSSPASWVAADLLAQAEHDELAIPTLITTSLFYAKRVRKEIVLQLKKLSRKKIARQSVKKNGNIYVVKDLSVAAEISNEIAPEHLELCVRSPKRLLKKINNAGAIFLGSVSTESYGDYICGPSHVLPTGGAARFSSPLSVYDFIKMPSTISMSKKGFRSLAGAVMDLAYAESLEAHALSVDVRLK